MQFQKISIVPPQKGLEFPGGGGFWKIKKYKEMYEALPEFPEGWGGVSLRKNPFRGGGFSGTTQLETQLQLFCQVQLS